MDKDAIFAPDHLRVKGSSFEPDLEECAKILEKPYSLRTNEENEKVHKMILDSKIFDKRLCDFCAAGPIVQNLLPSVELVHLNNGGILFHYEAEADKVYILLKGKIKDFVPKSLDELEEDFKRKNPKKPKRITHKFQPQEIMPRISQLLQRKSEKQQDNDDAKSNSSGGSDHDHKEVNLANPASHTFTKKLNVIKGILPFLKKEQARQSVSDSLMNLRYKRLIQKKRDSIIGNPIDMNDLEKQVDQQLMQEFVKKKNTYFISNILKVKFNLFMYPGDVFGVLALKDNSLRRRAIVATTNCKLLAISRDSFLKVLDQERLRLALKKKTFLAMFNRFSQGHTLSFSHLWTEEHYGLNDVLFNEGESSECFYLIGDGEFLLSKHSVGDKEVLIEENKKKLQMRAEKPKKLLVSRIAQGSFIGEDEFFLQQNREFTATVKSNTAEVYKLTREAFNEAKEKFPVFVSYIVRGSVDKYAWQQNRLQKLVEHFDVDMGESARLYKDLLHEMRIAAFLAEIPSRRLVKKIKLNLIDKEKPVNLHNEYDQLWVPKPGQPHSRAISSMMEKIDNYMYSTRKLNPPNERSRNYGAASANCSPVGTPRNKEDRVIEDFQSTPQAPLMRTLREDGKLSSPSTTFYKTFRSSSVPENKEYLINQYYEQKIKNNAEENAPTVEPVSLQGTLRSTLQISDLSQVNEPKLALKSMMYQTTERYRLPTKSLSSTFYNGEKSKSSRSITPGPGGFPLRENLGPGKLKRMIPVEVPPRRTTPITNVPRIHNNPDGEGNERAQSIGRERLHKGPSITRGLEQRASVSSLRTSRPRVGSLAESADLQRTSRDFTKNLNSILSTSGPNFFKNNPDARQRMFESYQNIQNFLV